MDPILLAFNDDSFKQLVREKLPYLYQIAEIECSRDGKIGMEVGSTREKILIALLIEYFGKSRVLTSIPITEPETDVIVDDILISIKTITGKGGVKVSWTVDAPSAMDFVKSYSPHCGILFTRINWDMKRSNEPSGLFWIPLETQKNNLEKLGVERYLKLPKPGTNPRGIELSRIGLETLLLDRDTARIRVTWSRSDIDYDPYTRWVEYWKEKIDNKKNGLDKIFS